MDGESVSPSRALIVMETFETHLYQATRPENREILGAIAAVVDREGTLLYHHASGYQSPAPNAPSLSPHNTFMLGSAGKFITHVAALQCVDRGMITLDEPVYSRLPELETIKIISRHSGPDCSARPFLLRFPSKKITLRHLLTHSSGIGSDDHPLLHEWRVATPEEPNEHLHPIVRLFSMPLLFEPGEGWCYGASIAWTQLLVSRLTNQSFPQYVEENIFNTLGVTSSTYHPQSHPNLCSRLLQMVKRGLEGLAPLDDQVHGLISTVTDITALLADLISPSPRLLSKEITSLVFTPQFSPSSAALTSLRRDTETYSAPAGIPLSMREPPVNYSLAGLLVEEELPLSHMPPGTVTWNGMPNVIWAMNREKGLVMMFATQLLPVDDSQTASLAMSFFRSAWDRFS